MNLVSGVSMFGCTHKNSLPTIKILDIPSSYKSDDPFKWACQFITDRLVTDVINAVNYVTSNKGWTINAD